MYDAVLLRPMEKYSANVAKDSARAVSSGTGTHSPLVAHATTLGIPPSDPFFCPIVYVKNAAEWFPFRSLMVIKNTYNEV